MVYAQDNYLFTSKDVPFDQLWLMTLQKSLEGSNSKYTQYILTHRYVDYLHSACHDVFH